MTGQIVKFDAAVHHESESLLPWFVNGTLAGEELAMVEQHIHECVRCQREVDRLCTLQAAYRESEMESDIAQSLRKIQSRIGIAHPSWWNKLHQFWIQTHTGARWAIVMQTISIVILGCLIFIRPEPNLSYRVLSAAPIAQQPPANLVIVFNPQIAEADLRRIVQGVGARIVDGPMQTNAYLLALPADQQTAALQKLRSEQSVTLVEPLSMK